MRKPVILVSLVWVLLAAPLAHAVETVPFGPGEKLSYEIYWTFIHAGDAVLEVMPDTEINGTPARYFKATASTVPWVDAFYKVRDVLEAWTDLEVTHSLRYTKDQNEGTYHKKVDLVFDKETNQSRRYTRGILQHTLDQPVDVFDPMSVLFSFRKQILYKSMQFGANVSDGKKTVVGESTVEAMETIKTGIGPIQCFRVRLDIKHLSGVFKKSRDAELLVWFSADARRIPVKVKSKVKVGHFTMELVGYQPPSSSKKETAR
ncbi:DUF3108 domain-containing protein [Pseudodesulfovibrio sp. JC047]|uniref:DUF3108 domain-containing protein n=1 Tax=Pseudodesulfovibrio sp. JC047 TaxID=2683199 RepID=UPI0013D7FC0E|nr:DUF3108 domain-containing protein [Pseudodesulfovibrio sp. JC047]NDV18899.1 DUF3108 domain-containing protein [Pseudodesulfovibrio sp. JC047]